MYVMMFGFIHIRNA